VIFVHPLFKVLNSSEEIIATNHGWNGLSSISEVAASVGAFAIDAESQNAARDQRLYHKSNRIPTNSINRVRINKVQGIWSWVCYSA
jgi:hypothetical protein